MVGGCNTTIALKNIFAITSVSSDERNAHLLSGCAVQGLTCTLVPGVDKQTLDVDELRRASLETSWVVPVGMALPRHNLSAGEYALALAHRNAYDLLILNALPCALVLENDATFSRTFAQELGALAVPWHEVDLLKLGSCSDGAPDARHRPLRIAVGSGGWCSTGSIVTHRGARRLRDVQTPVWTVADGALRLWDNSSRKLRVRGRGGHLEMPPVLRVMHTIPPVVTQDLQLRRHSEVGQHCGERRENC